MRKRVPPLLGSAARLLLMVGIAAGMSHLPHPAAAQPSLDQEGRPNPYSLNIRFSSRPVVPPQEYVFQTIPLEGLRAAKPVVGPAPKAAILEDDSRNRVVILSNDENGTLQAYVLERLDLTPRIPELKACTRQRECGADRMAMTGGLGCIAICLKDLVESLRSPAALP